MRTKLMVLSAAVALVGAGAWAVLASTGASADSSQTITVIATHAVFTTADVGDPGDSIGDELVFTAVDKNLDGDVVGRLDGHCVYTQIANGADLYEQCFLTHTLRGGQITLQGQFQQGVDGDQAFAVTGGTGSYTQVQGQAILKFQRRYRFDIQLQQP